jgi:predicted nucleic acid-binding protein
MKTVFADTSYWIALLNPNDNLHPRAKEIGPKLQPFHIVTTDEILVEFLAFFSKFGEEMRKAAVRLVRRILQNPNATVLPQTRESFLRGLQLYESRPDKGYSLTDCVSMETMRGHKLQEVLTNDHHFEQEGFVILLKDVSE